MADFTIQINQSPAYAVEITGGRGPAGPQGPAGAGTDPEALHISQRLSEFNTQAARQQARESLELETIDLGTF